ncbi:heme biosynthesis HemY N-terminal domain-containing protein [uncultured Thiothrix sp.]|uniref:heme biosynthesis HemY N-terminal domain-containing protein n=1 Tax=uncultured Thiothrix sp. TaxID=223185 RepID=UPI002632E021|nr:heme biosynthesis HemY N-terminal domain-containing protein [uncultured Thiothrix sp.]
MMRFILLSILLGLSGFWVTQQVLTHSGPSFIKWGSQVYELTTATLALLVLGACMAFYLGLTLVRELLGLRRRLHRLRDHRLHTKANHSLNQGLIQLTEGHWSKAEQLLTEHAERSETPLLNYLGAARAAHMQEAPERRDELLKKAIESDHSAQIAVGVSQAEMQLSAEQLEQAHATLLNLRSLAPKNAYVTKLLAKVLYKQQNWEALLDLLPDLQKLNLLNSESMSHVQAATLVGLFSKYAEQKNTEKLQTLWKRLPTAIREQSEAMNVYTRALHQADADALAEQFITTVHANAWYPQLADLYGRLEHANLANAVQNAEKWLAPQPANPVSLLLLARLHRQQKLWGVAKSYYETSLNQAPDPEAYLELAELLEVMGETSNAEHCYKLGLRYCIRQQGERLVLAASQHPKKPVETSYQPAPTF